MPTNAYSNSRYATLTAAQVIAEQERQLAQWKREDNERRARNAAILAAL